MILKALLQFCTAKKFFKLFILFLLSYCFRTKDYAGVDRARLLPNQSYADPSFADSRFNTQFDDTVYGNETEAFFPEAKQIYDSIPSLMTRYMVMKP